MQSNQTITPQYKQNTNLDLPFGVSIRALPTSRLLAVLQVHWLVKTGFLELRLYAPCQADRTLETVRLAETLHGESGEPIITSFINKNESLCLKGYK